MSEKETSLTSLEVGGRRQVTDRMDNDNDNNRTSQRKDSNGNGSRPDNSGRQFRHPVSIVVVPVMDDTDESNLPLDMSQCQDCEISVTASERRSPILLIDDIAFSETAGKPRDDEIVKSIIVSRVKQSVIKRKELTVSVSVPVVAPVPAPQANARLRKEEFVRLLEEHAQLVNEINRVETSLL